MLRKYRVPLVVFTPKSLLRLPAATSPIEEMTGGRFHRVLDDASVPEPSRVRTVLFCSGKVFYDLAAHRAEVPNGATTALVRIEQIYPFPHDELRPVLARYPHAVDFRWVQEEPRNNGAWGFVKDLLTAMIAERRRADGNEAAMPLAYVGRPAAASPAVGSAWRSGEQQRRLVAAAFRERKRSAGADVTGETHPDASRD
jgi:2-oxoglutarate dehydrogenase E1 component